MKLGASYFGNRIVRYVAQDMKNMVDHHCNYVIHTFSENDFHFYRGTMKEIVKVSHDAGLGVYIDPWGVGKVFGGEAFSDFVMNNPQALQVLSDGKPVGVACLNHPDFRAFMKDWIDAAVETGADCLFWDEPHFYLPSWMGGRQNTWGCLCAVCQQKFKTKVFILSTIYEGLAASIFAHYSTFLCPVDFGLNYSIRVVTMGVVGGMSSIWGGLLGASVLSILPQFLDIFAEYDILIYGLVLILSVIFMPEGISQKISLCWEKCQKKWFHEV